MHSDADAGMPFVAEADLAVRLPGNAPADTYLRGDLVVEAARRAGADAVHPGYGFLSESAGLRPAVIAAGLTWVGPPRSPWSRWPPRSRQEADGRRRRAGARRAQPGASPSGTSRVLVKASAGGGGRGMRVVRDLAALGRAVAQASAEAASAFGDPTVFCEPYVEQGRHIEVQVLGDSTGDAWSSASATARCSAGTRRSSRRRRRPGSGRLRRRCTTRPRGGRGHRLRRSRDRRVPRRPGDRSGSSSSR